jgi:putative colanic acid biosynthesis UDP-glucose lipid carrier transferase
MGVRGILQEHSVALGVALRALDLLAILVTGLIAYHWLFGTLVMPVSYKMAIVVGLLFSLILFNRSSLYRAWRGSSATGELWVATGAWASVFLGLSAVAFITQQAHAVEVAWVLHWMVFSWFALVGFRVVLRLLLRGMRAHGFNHRKMVLVVAGELGVRVGQRLRQMPWTGLEVLGYFDDRPIERLPDIGELPLLGRISELGAFVQQRRVDQVWLAFPFRAENRVKQVLHELRHCTADIRMVPDIFQFRLLNHSMSEVGGIPVLNLTSSPMVGFDQFLKEIEDRVLAFLILFGISPLMLIVALMVKASSPGPVFFKQVRHGWDGKPIEVWKFRTMNLHDEHSGTVTQAVRNDPRVTALGRFLRSTSLDELPQFINVLQGRMSIVGPRPHAIEHNEQFKESVEQYMLRHKVKPGITGWAQVNGYRGETNTLEKMQKRVELDLFYIENWSIWLDLRIILKTLIRGFSDKNAY